MEKEEDLQMNDDVKPSESVPEKVIHEKLIYYCSSFDLNVNEWFTEYENTLIFKKRMKLKLGKKWHHLIHYLGHNWVKYFSQAMEVAITHEHENDGWNDSEEMSSEDTEDVASNHCLNIAIEFYLTRAIIKDEVSHLKSCLYWPKYYLLN